MLIRVRETLVSANRHTEVNSVLYPRRGFWARGKYTGMAQGVTVYTAPRVFVESHGCEGILLDAHDDE